MYALEIVIEGKASMPGEQPWLRQELQKFLDLHGPFIGLDLTVVKAQAHEVADHVYDLPSLAPSGEERG